MESSSLELRSGDSQCLRGVEKSMVACSEDHLGILDQLS